MKLMTSLGKVAAVGISLSLCIVAIAAATGQFGIIVDLLWAGMNFPLDATCSIPISAATLALAIEGVYHHRRLPLLAPFVLFLAAFLTWWVFRFGRQPIAMGRLS